MTHYRIIDEMDVSGEKLLMLIGKLPEWRRQEAMRFKYENGKRECTMSYLLLCDMLNEYFGISEQPRFAIGEHGKPTLVFCDKMQNIHFNLSHCKNAIACAISDDGEVGIDVECLGRYKLSLAEYCMSADEVQSICNAADPDLEFTRLWTRKEALLKYTGEGIMDDMKDILRSSRVTDISFHTTENIPKGYVCTMVKKGKVVKSR